MVQSVGLPSRQHIYHHNSQRTNHHIQLQRSYHVTAIVLHDKGTTDMNVHLIKLLLLDFQFPVLTMTSMGQPSSQ